MSAPPHFKLNVDDEVKRLIYEMRVADPDTVLTAAIRLLRMVLDYDRERSKITSPSMITKQQAKTGTSDISWEELEEDVASALRLWLTIKANAPVSAYPNK